MKFIFALKKYYEPYRKKIFWGSVFIIASVLLIMFLSQLTQLFIDSVYYQVNVENASASTLWGWLENLLASFKPITIVLTISAVFIICAFIKNFLSVFSSRLFFQTGSNLAGDLRKACFKKLAFMDRRKNLNEAYFNFTNDINDCYDLFNSILPSIIKNLALMTFGLIFALFIDWKSALALAVCVGIIILVSYIKITKQKNNQVFEKSRKNKSDMFKYSENMLTNIKEIKTFGSEEEIITQYDSFNKNHTLATERANKTIYNNSILINIIKALGIGVAVVLASLACFNFEISIGYLVLFIAYALYSLHAATDLIDEIFRGKVAQFGVERISEFLSQETHINEGGMAINILGTIECRNLALNLNGRSIFKKLNLKFEIGKNYLIHIPQGEGKTAFARTLLGFLPITKGKIYINQKSSNKYSINSIRNQISYISQEPFLFQDSIKNNILMFAEYDELKFQKVIEICSLKSTINKFKEKENYVLSENAPQLSSQEKQQINFARALYKNAPLLLIDNAFNKFNYEFKISFLRKIKAEYQNKSVIFLSDKKQPKKLFDVVYQIKNGESLEVGND